MLWRCQWKQAPVAWPWRRCGGDKERFSDSAKPAPDRLRIVMGWDDPLTAAAYAGWMQTSNIVALVPLEPDGRSVGDRG
jgi:hypothetical protein